MPNPENLKGKGFESRPENINKGGRPVGAKSRSTIVQKWLSAEIEDINPLTKTVEKLSVEDIITLGQIKEAWENGTSMAYKVLMDSAYGAVQQKVDLTTQGETLNPVIEVYNSAPPMARSEEDIDQD